MKKYLLFIALFSFSCSYDGSEFEKAFDKAIMKCNGGQLCRNNDKDICVDLGSDKNNCGQCGKACGEKGICFKGDCYTCKGEEKLNDNKKCYCPGFNNDQPDAVYNTNDHCGSCGNKCGKDSECKSGKCVCAGTDKVSCFGSACSIDLKNDPKHCGECDNQCSALPNVDNETCSDSQCHFGCKPDFGNCDNDPANGCESDLKSSEYCGSCENNCNVQLLNAEDISCNAGICEYKKCINGYGDCKNQPSDGCETSLSNTIDHCGACGYDCNVQLLNAEDISCNAGNCEYKNCINGYGDCKNQPSDGCETSLSNTIDHCGACGYDCNVQLLNAEDISCNAGNCEYEKCKTGYGDCDGKKDNGCEAGLTTTQNCNTCGADCAKEFKNVAIGKAECILGSQTYTCSYSIISCKTGFKNCDGKEYNGCEHDLKNGSCK